MAANERHVRPNPSGGWEVVLPGASRTSAVFKKQSDAITRAREILKGSGGGELVVHDREAESGRRTPSRRPATLTRRKTKPRS